MALNTIGASIPAARQLVAATESAGGTAPQILHDLLAGVDLLAKQPAASDPVKPIVSAAADGTLNEQTLTELLAQASRDASAADYRGQIRARCETAFLDRYFRALCCGGADAILDSLRPEFDQAAQTLANATSVIDINVDPRQLAEHGTPEELEAWRSIRPAVAKLDEIAGVARRFGPRSSDFAVIDLPNLIDHRGLLDEALLCTSSDLMQAGQVFRGRSADVRSTPWLRLTPHLCTIAEAKERLRVWAEHSWCEWNSNPPGHFDEKGNVVPQTRVNPYALKADV